MAFKKYTQGTVNHIVEFYECSCQSSEHLLKFKILDDKELSSEIYLEIFLLNEKNLLKRIIRGVRYIFGHKSKYGHFDEFILKKEEVDNLKNLIKTYETINNY
jgi:hypothetical protein